MNKLRRTLHKKTIINNNKRVTAQVTNLSGV